MKPIKFQTTITEDVARALPELRPLLGKQVEMVVAALDQAREAGRLTLDEFLASRLVPEPGVGLVSVEHMDRGIGEAVTARFRSATG